MPEKKVPPARIERTTPGLGILPSCDSCENPAARCGGIARHGGCSAGEIRSVPHFSAARLWADCGLSIGPGPSVPAPSAPPGGSPLPPGGALHSWVLP